MSFGRSHFFPEDIPDIHNILISGVPNNGLLSPVAREGVFKGLRPRGRLHSAFSNPLLELIEDADGRIIR
jgi:hypothetical protein